MCNSELYLTVVRGGLAGQSGAVGQRGGRWLRCLCVSRVGTHPLHLPSALLHARARKRVYIYMRVCAGCACVAPYKHYLHVLDGGGREDAPDRRLIHTREYCSPFSPLSSVCTRCQSWRPISYASTPLPVLFYFIPRGGRELNS